MSPIKYALMVGLLFPIGGCKEDPAVAEVAAFADKMCACQEPACADAVRLEMIAYAKENKAKMVSRDENRKVHDHLERAEKCLDVLTKPVASTDVPQQPSAPVPPAPSPSPRP